MAKIERLTRDQILHCWHYVGNKIDSFGIPVTDNFDSIVNLVRHVEDRYEELSSNVKTPSETGPKLNKRGKPDGRYKSNKIEPNV